MHIQEKQIEVVFLCQGQCLSAIVCQPHLVAVAQEQLLEELGIEFIVLGHQDAQRPGSRLSRGRRRRRYSLLDSADFRLAPEVRSEGEGASPAWRASYGNLPA